MLLPYFDSVGSVGLGSCIRPVLPRHTYHIAMIDTLTCLSYMIEDVGKPVSAGNSESGVADNHLTLSLKYQQGVTYSLFCPIGQ